MLEDHGETTLLKYTAKAEIRGKIAQLGSRLLVSTGKKWSGQFFASFADIMENGLP